MLLKLPSLCPKWIRGNSAIPWQDPPFSFHIFFTSVGPSSPTSKIPHRLKFLAFKTCPNCIGRSRNSSTDRQERQLHLWTSMFTTEHFRRSSLHETSVSRRPDTHGSYVTFMPAESTEMSIARKNQSVFVGQVSESLVLFRDSLLPRPENGPGTQAGKERVLYYLQAHAPYDFFPPLPPPPPKTGAKTIFGKRFLI